MGGSIEIQSWIGDYQLLNKACPKTKRESKQHHLELLAATISYKFIVFIYLNTVQHLTSSTWDVVSDGNTLFSAALRLQSTNHSLVTGNHPHQGQIQPQNLKAKGDNPKLDTNATGKTTWQDAVAGHGITPVGSSSNRVIVYILDRVEANKDAKKERKVSQHGIKYIPFNVDCECKYNGKEYTNVNDGFVGIQTVYQGTLSE